MLAKGPYKADITEKEMLDFWLKSKFYAPEYASKNKLSTASTKERENYTIILPPPNANGNLHLGHMSGYVYQDLMGRYQRMKGKKVLLLPGKDHAGIQTEVVFERELEERGLSKRQLGRDKFYRKCYDFCMKNSEVAREQEQKIGLSADYDRELFTLDPKIVKEILDAFILMYEDGLIYRDKRLINWCTRCQSALADIDTEFKDAQNPFFYFKYAFIEPEPFAVKIKNDFTGKTINWEYELNYENKKGEKLPFTYGEVEDKQYLNPNDGDPLDVVGLGYENLKPGDIQSGRVIGLQFRLDLDYNMIVAHPDLSEEESDKQLEDYFLFSFPRHAGSHIIKFKDYPEDKFYTNGFILATVRPETKFGDTALAVDPDDERYREYVGKKFTVQTLTGTAELTVIADNAVEEEFGTGMVKVTPAHAPEDFEIAKRHPDAAFPEKQVIDFFGRLNHLTGKYEGMTVAEARKAMIEDMREQGMLIYLDENYTNRIRICERCKTPIEPLISYQWFVDTKPLKDKAKQLVEDDFTQILPDGKEKTYLQWMDTPEDWCITRQLWWGYRLPVWYKGQKQQYITETGEVKEKISQQIVDKQEDYENLLYIGKDNPNYLGKVYLVPGEYGYLTRKIFPDLAIQYPNCEEIFIENIESPTYQDYKSKFEKISLSENDTLIGHSLGNLAILKFIEENDIQLKNLVLIAPPGKAQKEYLDSSFGELFAEMNYQRIEDKVEKIYIMFSDNDEMIPLEDFKQLISKFKSVTPLFEEGKQHYAGKTYDYHSPALHKLLEKITSENRAAASKELDIEIEVIRHGETQYNLENRFGGWSEEQLTETGKNQVEQFAKDLKQSGADYNLIITSDLPRATETSKIIASETGIEILESELIRERDWGNLTGLTWEEFEQKFPEEAARNKPNYQEQLEKGESIAEITARVERFINFLKANHSGKKILIITHTGVIRIFKRLLAQSDIEASPENDPENLKGIKAKIEVNQWIQDDDVLDTWFSSGQWPFATLQAKAGDYEKFYPTQVMETGWDILIFWVTRMMLLNPYRAEKFAKQNSKEGQSQEVTDAEITPFKDVYLHGLVLDKEGVKMSKSKGNGIDPFLMMQKYGTDALRFSFVSGNSPGQNYRLYEEKIAANRNFCNKIWNAGKFVLMNIKDNAENLPDLDISALQTEQEDRDFIAHLNTLITETDRRFESFQFGIAATELYESFWHTFADVYIEQVKNRLYTKDKDGNSINTSESEQASRLAAQYTLFIALETYLKLLHPFIPFITEKIWQEVPKRDGEAETIMYTSWPVAKD